MKRKASVAANATITTGCGGSTSTTATKSPTKTRDYSVSKRARTTTTSEEAEEYDENNKGQLTIDGWNQLMLWAQSVSKKYDIPQDWFISGILDIGCGRGDVLLFAAKNYDPPFKKIVGVEKDPATMYLSDLSSLRDHDDDDNHISIYKNQDASDETVMPNLLKDATFIFWNGMKFQDKTRGKITNLITNHTKVGTIIITNVSFPPPPRRSPFRIMLEGSMTFSNFKDPLVSWSHSCEWNCYLTLPATFLKNRNLINKNLSWIFETYRTLYYIEEEESDLSNLSKITTVADIKRIAPTTNITHMTREKLCRILWGSEAPKKQRRASKKRKREFCDDPKNVIITNKIKEEEARSKPHHDENKK
jgi:SAM-dependent methyltransferase